MTEHVPDWVAEFLNRRTDVENTLRKWAKAGYHATAEDFVSLATKLGVPAEFGRPSPDNTVKGESDTFQARVEPWMGACFGPEISGDKVERGDRLLEEVFETLQSGGYDPGRVAPLRDYVWARPIGEPSQEVGGVMVTLAAYCLAFGLDMHSAGETELARIWTKVEKIRAKQAAKPKFSPLPEAPVSVKGEISDEAVEAPGYGYMMSEPHLSGYRLSFGFATREQMHAFQDDLLRRRKAHPPAAEAVVAEVAQGEAAETNSR